MDPHALDRLRRTQPGWRLLRADHAPLVVGFFQRAFIEANLRALSRPEKAIEWIARLDERPFVATESRLLTVSQLLRQMVEGTELDPAVRIAELEKRNFRRLDRGVRERIATWEGGKGALLEDVFGERDVIADSDQSRSFRAFWDFLMSAARQDELTSLLERVFALALQKIHIIEPYVAAVGFVHNEQGRQSMLRNLTIEEYRAERAARAAP